jgi:hypothetical protein
MAGKPVKFTLSKEAVAYLRWYAKTVLLEETAEDAARHLLLKQIEAIRREHRKDDPDPGTLPTEESS